MDLKKLPPQEKKFQLEEFVIDMSKDDEVLLGTGSFAKVYRAMHRKLKKKFAIKVKKQIEKIGKIYKERLTYIKNYNMNLLQNSIHMKWFIKKRSNKIFIILEFAENGNLFNFLKKQKKPLSTDQVRVMYRQICEGVQSIHANGIVHRDLKPENILLDKKLHPKICDFGWSTEIGQSEQRDTFCGTYEYMAPEIFENEKYNGSVDVWSLGVLLYEMFHGYSPFGSKSIFKIYRNIVEEGIKFKDGMDEKAKNLILITLKNKADQRPSIHKILKHPFFTGDPLDINNPDYEYNKEVEKLNQSEFIDIVDGQQKVEKQESQSKLPLNQKSKKQLRFPQSRKLLKKKQEGKTNSKLDMLRLKKKKTTSQLVNTKKQADDDVSKKQYSVYDKDDKSDNNSMINKDKSTMKSKLQLKRSNLKKFVKHKSDTSKKNFKSLNKNYMKLKTEVSQKTQDQINGQEVEKEKKNLSRDLKMKLSNRLQSRLKFKNKESKNQIDLESSLNSESENFMKNQEKDNSNLNDTINSKQENSLTKRINNSSHVKRMMLRTPTNRNKMKNISLKSLQKDKKKFKDNLKIESKNYLKRKILNQNKSKIVPRNNPKPRLQLKRPGTNSNSSTNKLRLQSKESIDQKRERLKTSGNEYMLPSNRPKTKTLKFKGKIFSSKISLGNKQLNNNIMII